MDRRGRRALRVAHRSPFRGSPLLGAGLTLLVFLSGIVRQGEATHLAATGLDQQPYLGRWLVLVAAMFALSAVVYLVRLRPRSRSRAAT
jgi:hypothetical protein